MAPQGQAQAMWRHLDALGPLRPPLEDDSLTEIMVNGADMVYVERGGKILLTDVRFDDENHLLRVIDLIVTAVGRRIDFRHPLCHARLLHPSRSNAEHPPEQPPTPFHPIPTFSPSPSHHHSNLTSHTLT